MCTLRDAPALQLGVSYPFVYRLEVSGKVVRITQPIAIANAALVLHRKAGTDDVLRHHRPSLSKDALSSLARGYVAAGFAVKTNRVLQEQSLYLHAVKGSCLAVIDRVLALYSPGFSMLNLEGRGGNQHVLVRIVPHGIQVRASAAFWDWFEQQDSDLLTGTAIEQLRVQGFERARAHTHACINGLGLEVSFGDAHASLCLTRPQGSDAVASHHAGTPEHVRALLGTVSNLEMLFRAQNPTSA